MPRSRAEADFMALQAYLSESIHLRVGPMPSRRPSVASLRQALLDLGALTSPEPPSDIVGLFSAWLSYLAKICSLPLVQPPRMALSEDPSLPPCLTIDLKAPLFIDAALWGELANLAWSSFVSLEAMTASQVEETLRQPLIKSLQRRVPGGASTLPVLEAAHALGVPYLHVGQGIYQLGLGARGRLIDRSATRGDSAVGARISQHKGLTCHMLGLAGVPVPEGLCLNDAKDLPEAISRLGYPLVVKPADAERGEGVSVGVGSHDGLLRSFDLAKAASRRGEVIVERQLRGVCHRVFVAGGRVLYVVKRWPPHLRGNGVSTVSELALELRSRMSLFERLRYEDCPYLMGEESLRCVSSQGLAADSVPAVGQRIFLRPIENSAWGGVDEDMTGFIHRDYVSLAERCAEILGLSVAGIDVMCEDITRPYEQGAAVIEVNFAPLLGGGEVSRAHLPEFLRRYLGGVGATSFERFSGPGALTSAQICLTALRQSGLRVELVADSQGRALAYEARAARVRSLALRRNVDAIVVLE